jgi:hypothetical protein
MRQQVDARAVLTFDGDATLSADALKAAVEEEIGKLYRLAGPAVDPVELVSFTVESVCEEAEIFGTEPKYGGDVALAAMCLWEAVVAPDSDDETPWHDDRECEGTCYLRDRILGMAEQCDADWQYAREHMGFDDSFDWEFAPGWLRHNYGHGFKSPAERLAWLSDEA